jgi:SAM-dependent methyltransferase
MSEINKTIMIPFVCPECKNSLHSFNLSLRCDKCDRNYPIIDEIPDFISGDFQTKSTPIFKMARKADLLSSFYESKYWYQLSLKLAGASTNTIESITKFHSETLKNINGSILDVACGTATYSRRIISSSRNVYGIDISMGMLKKGMSYLKRAHISDVYLSRASVDKLPFINAVFDGAICSGSLHLFPDTVLSLREIARTMKAGAPLSVQTFTEGTTIVNRMLKKQSWVHNFKIDELQQYLSEAGFEGFRWKLDGPIVIFFSAYKAS